MCVKPLINEKRQAQINEPSLLLGLDSPVRLLRHRWNCDDHFLGGWAIQPPSMLDDAVENLSEPLPSGSDPRLLFAGEATDHRFFGNFLGARSVRITLVFSPHIDKE